jgi:hypothetical protein
MEERLKLINSLLLGYPEIAAAFSFNLEQECSEWVLKQLNDYINTHKWLVNEKIPYEITIEQAFFSWYENVFRPQAAAMEKTCIYSSIKKNKSALFDLVSKKKYFMVTMGLIDATYEEACWKIIYAEAKGLKRFFARMKVKN